MKELTETIVQALVDKPEQVAVDIVDGRFTSLLKLSVGDGDTGKIIGRHGRTANALRTILNAAAARENRRVVLEIQENGHRPPRIVSWKRDDTAHA